MNEFKIKIEETYQLIKNIFHSNDKTPYEKYTWMCNYRDSSENHQLRREATLLYNQGEDIDSTHYTNVLFAAESVWTFSGLDRTVDKIHWEDLCVEYVRVIQELLEIDPKDSLSWPYFHYPGKHYLWDLQRKRGEELVEKKIISESCFNDWYEMGH